MKQITFKYFSFYWYY